jgi:hypothetical protein
MLGGGGVGLLLLAGMAGAQPFPGGLPACQRALEACEAEPNAVFPGDGVDGPALNYTDNGDTVTDNNTLLMWEKKVAGGSAGCPTDAANLHGVDSTCTWAQATGAWIAAINVANLGSHSDWRVPNVKELQSLVDYGVSLPGPTIDATFPGATAADLYWSSTTYVGNPSAAWPVNFSNGFVMVGTPGTKTNSHRVRAVRGGR